MVEHADVLDIYRTYPHVDMAATGRRSALQLAALIEGGTRLHKAYRQLPFMIPLTSGCTYEGPAKEVYHQVKLLAQGPGIAGLRSEEHTSELQSLMRTSYAVFCLKKKNKQRRNANKYHISKIHISI